VSARTAVSSGLVLFRRSPAGLEVFLAHPGGPFWAKRDEGAWTIPKGIADDGEDLLDAARREFHEETGIAVDGPFVSLGAITQKAGKTVHAWACEGDADPGTVVSNTTEIAWPLGSGRRVTIPEVDRCAWFDVQTARVKVNPAQVELIDRLVDAVGATAPPRS
jgi:predicted NUDIX family NTP pyrophosphohydrolase